MPDGVRTPGTRADLERDVTDLIRRIADMICGEQPGVPRPEDFSELDSFSVVQVLIELEGRLGVELLERLESFTIGSFPELGTVVVQIAEEAPGGTDALCDALAGAGSRAGLTGPDPAT